MSCLEFLHIGFGVQDTGSFRRADVVVVAAQAPGHLAIVLPEQRRRAARRSDEG